MAKKPQQKPVNEPDNPDAEEVYKPMAVPEPDPIERLAALELKVRELETWKAQVDKVVVRVVRDHSYIFGGSTA